MSRKILVISTVLLLVGVAVLIYADPLARLSLGVSTSRVSFTSSFTRTFSFANSTFTVGPGSAGFPTGLAGARAVDTNGQAETLVALGLLAVGIVLEVMTIFLWQGKPKPAPTTPAPAPTTPA